MAETKDKKTESGAEKTMKETVTIKKQANSVLPDNITSSKKTRKFVNKKFEGRKSQNRKSSGKPRSEFEQKIISLRRVTRVVAGGRRFSFSAGMVIGDRNGSVGVGLGKASDTALAIEKAIRDAKKNLITPLLTKTRSIPYDVEAKYCASRVMIVPTPGKGLKAGGAVRAVLDLLGAKDVTSKILSRSKNHINNAKATVEALRKVGVKSPVEKSSAVEGNKVNTKKVNVLAG